MPIIGFLTGKLIGPIASAAAVVLLGLLIASRIHGAVLQRQVDRLDASINNPKTGYVVQIATLRGDIARLRGFIGTYKTNEGIYMANEAIFRGRIAVQNTAVEALRAEGARRAALFAVASVSLAAEKASGQRLAQEIITMRPTANAALDSDLFILRAVQ